MEVGEYISQLGVIVLPVFIKQTSDATLEFAEEFCKQKVARVSLEFPNIDVYCELVDFRTQNRYICFSHNMVIKYQIGQQFNTALDVETLKAASVNTSVTDNSTSLESVMSAMTSYVDMAVELHVNQLKAYVDNHFDNLIIPETAPQDAPPVVINFRDVLLDLSIIKKTINVDLHIRRKSVNLAVTRRTVGLEAISEQA